MKWCSPSLTCVPVQSTPSKIAYVKAQSELGTLLDAQSPSKTTGATALPPSPAPPSAPNPPPGPKLKHGQGAVGRLDSQRYFPSATVARAPQT